VITRRDERHRYRPLVMMVDDDDHDRAMYGGMLCYNGFDVVLAFDAASALRLAALHSPDIVLLDLGLPDRNGIEVCEELRRRHSAADTPIIALSAFAERDMGQRARAAGCTVYVEKPASPVHVLHVIEEFIGRAPLPGNGPAPRVLP
jgi:two-component system, cell cycle response regulator DivK